MRRASRRKIVCNISLIANVTIKIFGIVHKVDGKSTIERV
jgi:hypothetical protein